VTSSSSAGTVETPSTTRMVESVETLDLPLRADHITDQLVEQARAAAMFVREETLRLTAIAKSGHITSIFSCAEIFATLYNGGMRISRDPEWAERDRFIFGKGHAAIGWYPLLAELGYFDRSVMDTYAHLGNPLGDHPDMRKVVGSDFSSGSLGHGLSVGLGMAMGLRQQGNDTSQVFVLCGDQELNEGQIWEAAQSASHFQVNNLVAIVDRNQLGLDASTEETLSVEPIDERFRAFGWNVIDIDGHDVRALYEAYAAIPRRSAGAPTVIIARTVKGKGVRYMEESRLWHVGLLVGDDYDDAIREIRQGLA
jgi:transketolase